MRDWRIGLYISKDVTSTTAEGRGGTKKVINLPEYNTSSANERLPSKFR